MMRRINERRVRHGRPRLKSDAHLIYVARRHARTMASAGSIYHDDRLGRRITRWRRLGQNVGTGGDCGSLMRAFMRSDAHRSNVLGTWRHLGVGVQRSDGRIYVQQIFESRFDPGNVYNYP